ncbi:hypothetical protein Q8A67_010044 [Cirrhinus molitorella]|uniref:cAMP-dependent protein kinase type II-alpha regulatory subunit n=3 Tax=Cirrhinus TaxID=59897 RepID=A0AA88Q3D0_9TELE|nr:hypothetical protein Q8A67_010044 [Cirrhinus molitorella]
MSIEIPVGLTELLQGYTVEVLRQRPPDLVEFAVQYFTRLRDTRSQDGSGAASAAKTGGKGVMFDGEPMQTESNGDEDDEDDDSDFEPPPPSRFNRRVSVCAEAFNPDDDDEDSEPRVVHPKTDEQRCRLQEACKDILLFKALDQEQFSQVLDAMFEVLVQPQDHVIDQGDDGDNFYVIERGVYDIVVQKDGVGCCVGQYDNKGSFGELALMYNTPRAATIIAKEEGALWGLDRATFRRLIVKNNAKKRRMYECFIESVPLLKSLEISERMKIVDVLGVKSFHDGERIIMQGDKADCFYVVESGEVKIMMKSKTKADRQDNAEVEITRCSRGQYFGELALVTNKPRAASAYAIGDVKCLVIDIQAFERLLGPCKEIMKRNIAHYEEQLVALFGSKEEERDSKDSCCDSDKVVSMCDGDISCAAVRIEPLHERWDLVEVCAELLNTQWQRSMGARIHSLRQSSHSYPVCLLLLMGERRSQDEKLIGHARLSRVLGSRSLFVESVVVCSTLRGKGYGRILMEGVERYAKGRGCTRLCLTTHDKQHFYAHLGFVLSKPVQNVGTLASFMPLEVLQKFCRSAENEEEGRNVHFNNPAPPPPSLLPPPPPPPPLSCPPPPSPIPAPPPPPSCPLSSLAPVNQTLEQTPYTDNRGLPIFWMHKDI